MDNRQSSDRYILLYKLLTKYFPPYMNSKSRLLIFLLAVILTITVSSCEGYRTVRGQILDSATKLPLDSVKCEVLTATNQTVYADSQGKFLARNNFGGCVPKCKDITIRLSRDKYNEQILTNPTDTVFYLIKRP